MGQKDDVDATLTVAVYGLLASTPMIESPGVDAFELESAFCGDLIAAVVGT